MCVKQLTMEERKAMSEEKWSEGGPFIELSAVSGGCTMRDKGG
jgi:hypothetical protein